MRRIWAYTSSGVRRKLEKTQKPVAGPEEALSILSQEGITGVAIKSLHLATGMEYKELRDIVKDRMQGQGAPGRIILSTPLLDATEDLDKSIRCLLNSLPSGTELCDALLLVAHGSRQPEAQAAYEATALFCRKFERRVLLGSLMSRPGLDEVIKECRALGIRSVVLAPLMIAAGFSARCEIAGNDPESWMSALSREGISCVPLMHGLGDHADIVSLWLDDVERMLTELSATEALAK